MTDNKELAEQYRLKQAEKLLALFEEAQERPALTLEELADWVASPGGKRTLEAASDPLGKIIPG